MTANEIVTELKKLGNAQTKKSWMTHGAQEPCLGVKIEDMKKIQKRVKVDYQLALDLYDTGIADAMISSTTTPRTALKELPARFYRLR